MNRQEYQEIKNNEKLEDERTAFKLAVKALQANPNFPMCLWVGCNLVEPKRSQVWRQAKIFCGISSK